MYKKYKNNSICVYYMEPDERIKELEKQVEELKEQLNKYLTKGKMYYEKNKEEHIKKVREYQKKNNYKCIPSPEKRKEYARRAYLKKKEKMLKEKNESEETQ